MVWVLCWASWPEKAPDKHFLDARCGPTGRPCPSAHLLKPHHRGSVSPRSVSRHHSPPGEAQGCLWVEEMGHSPTLTAAQEHTHDLGVGPRHSVLRAPEPSSSPNVQDTMRAYGLPADPINTFNPPHQNTKQVEDSPLKSGSQSQVYTGQPWSRGMGTGPAGFIYGRALIQGTRGVHSPSCWQEGGQHFSRTLAKANAVAVPLAVPCNRGSQCQPGRRRAGR